MKKRTIFCVWTMLVGLMLAVIAAVGACSAPQKAADPEPPAVVDEPAFCYAAVVGGQETIGCAETKPLCETARAAAAPAAEEASAQCWPVRLRLDRAAPAPSP